MATVKKIVHGIFTALAFPLYIFYLVTIAVGDKDQIFWSISQFLSLFPGKSGSYFRVAFYKLAMTKCDPECIIGFGTLFSQQDTEIGAHIYIGPNCNIGKCRIADDCTLGSGVHVMSGKRQHRFDDPDTPIRDQGGIFEKVTIGEDTWIGNSALIMADIGKKCIIGAGAVVTDSVPDFSIVAGNPAKLIRKRDQS